MLSKYTNFQKVFRILLITAAVALAVGAAGCAKPKVAVQVSQNQIQQGQDVKVTWKSENAKNVTLNGEKVDKVGSKVYTPSATTTYTAVATKGSKEARDSKTVDVNSRSSKPTISISADPEGIVRGTSTTLRWNSTHADTVDITGLGNVAASGSRAVSPDQSTTYTATATGPGGTDTSSTRVTVSEEPHNPGRTTTPNSFPGVAALFQQNVRVIYFDFDKAELLPEAKDTLRRAAGWLSQGDFRSITFRIEGNCDPRGTEEYNLGLGERRAQVAKDFLASLGVDASRMQTVSYGKERAAGSSEGSPMSPPSWAHDRRDDFVYVSGGASANPEPVTIYFEL